MTSAVMAGRQDRARASRDFFPTPPWATRALMREAIPADFWHPQMTCWEPSCGAGHMARPLAEYFGGGVFATDVQDRGFGDRRNLDFTFASARDAPFPVDWVITNPPFKLAEAFLHRALDIARVGVALLARLQWLEGQDRYRSIFGTDNAPTLICPFAERVAMIEGAWDPEASSATSYSWFVWVEGYTGRNQLRHIPPGAKARNHRPGDMAFATPGEARRRREARRG